MEFNPKVSIVIPVYNGSNYMKEAIDSALVQTYRNIEIIVINDGSTDDGKTDEIAKLYGDQIRYYYKENGGVASALNLGIQKMTGEYFSWLSHDDVYFPDKIEKQIEKIGYRENDLVIPFCESEIINEKAEIIKKTRIKQRYLRHVYLTILSATMGGCSLLIPKKCFDKVGLFDEDLIVTQDNEMWLRMAKAGFKFEYMPLALLKRRRHEDQTSKIMSSYHLAAKDEFYLWALRYIEEDAFLLFKDINRLLIKKKCFKARKELLKEKFRNYPVQKNFSLIKNWLLSFSYAERLIKRYKKVRFKSSQYWENRYIEGGNSGVGSYGILAKYKADFINSFMKKNNIESVIELGCGDGNQLALYQIKNYVGFDVSKTVITLCRDKFKADKTKMFHLYSELDSNKNISKADLTLSIDVLFHLVEEMVFRKHINHLFRLSNCYVIIYSTNFNNKYNSPHQVDRSFTEYIKKSIKNFKLIEIDDNPHKGRDSQADFYVYKRINEE